MLDVLQAIKDGTPLKSAAKQNMKIGADVLPAIPKDSTDRNRTSPFAFTGNKFEFRSVGSSLSIAGPNTALDAIVAFTLKGFADELEKSKDFENDVAALIKREITAHWRIIFNGNGYDSSWISEAENRGLLNLRTLPDAMSHYLAAKNVKLYTEMGVYTEDEMREHYEIKLEKYCQVLNIEVETMLEMINKDILPAAFKYIHELTKTASAIKAMGGSSAGSAQSKLALKLDGLAASLVEKSEDLCKAHIAAKDSEDVMTVARSYVDSVLPAMAQARAVADEIEPLLGEE